MARLAAVVEARILEREEQLEPLREQWDELAVRLGMPYAAPAWMLAWWHHAAPAGAAMRVVTVGDGERLLGIAPLFANGGEGRSAHYQLLSSRLAPPAPVLVDPEHAAEAIPALAGAIGRARPKPALLRIEGSREMHALTTEQLVAAWPGIRPEAQRTEVVPMPMVRIEGRSYEEWLGEKRSKFRHEAKRRRRKLEEAGGSFRLATLDDAEEAIDAFMRLHGARWQLRGGSTALVPGVREMLAEAAAAMLPSGRLRVHLLELEGKTIAVQIIVAAGPEAIGWSGGFDEATKSLAPAVQLTLEAIAEAAKHGNARFNLGPGGQAYKERLADERDEMAVVKLVPRGAAYPRTKLRMASEQARADLLPRLRAKLRRGGRDEQ
ncbi:MAG TPA: GNAT family N-acetyltransferase [Solirubrobacterales bacterium]|nr:GNAT family N-acetyltransferase [Solirubrobacterales bacterium]